MFSSRPDAGGRHRCGSPPAAWDPPHPRPAPCSACTPTWRTDGDPLLQHRKNLLGWSRRISPARVGGWRKRASDLRRCSVTLERRRTAVVERRRHHSRSRRRQAHSGVIGFHRSSGVGGSAAGARHPARVKVMTICPHRVERFKMTVTGRFPQGGVFHRAIHTQMAASVQISICVACTRVCVVCRLAVRRYVVGHGAVGLARITR